MVFCATAVEKKIQTVAAFVIGVDLAHVKIVHLCTERNFATIARECMNAFGAGGALEHIGSIAVFAEVTCALLAATTIAFVCRDIFLRLTSQC